MQLCEAEASGPVVIASNVPVRQSSVHFYTNCVAIVIKRGTVPSCVAVSVHRFAGIQCKRASNFRVTGSIFSAIDGICDVISVFRGIHWERTCSIWDIGIVMCLTPSHM
jgi:hypothetical protein